MQGLEQLKADNYRAAARELADLRADTLKGLAYAYQTRGVTGVLDLLTDAEVLGPVFDAFADLRRDNEG
jgi:hypothetical protein